MGYPLRRRALPDATALSRANPEAVAIPCPKVYPMPYFVYRVSPKLELDYIDTKDKYQEARGLVRELREGRKTDDDGDYRLIFAQQQGEAEKLLSTPRDERVIGED